MKRESSKTAVARAAGSSGLATPSWGLRPRLYAFVPNPIGIAYKDFHKDTTCQSPRPLDRTITISACDDNDYWVHLTYNVYECLDKSLALTEPPDKTVKTKVKCDNVMPHP